MGHADFDITDFSINEVGLTYPSTPSGPSNTAAVVNSVLQVTPGELSNVGAVWVTDPLPVTDGFTTIFEFEFLASPTGSGGGSGDGLALVFQNDSLDAIGNHAAASAGFLKFL